MKCLALLLSTVVLSGCFHWVPEGHDGMAEAYEVSYQDAATLNQLNAQRLVESQFLLHTLVLEGGLEIAPASLHRARMQWVRAMREHSNGLDQVVAEQLQVLDDQIAEMQTRVSRHEQAASRPNGKASL